MTTVTMPNELTAENGAKALMIGEFKEQTPIICPDCTDIIDRKDCLTCDGEGEFWQDVIISWTNIKDIYAMAVKNLGKY